MSYETITTVSNILNSKNGPLYAGMASIVVLTLAHMLTENNYSIYTPCLRMDGRTSSNTPCSNRFADGSLL